MAGQHSDGNEAANKQDVENDSGEGEEGDAAKAAGENSGSDGIEDCNA